MKSKIQLANSDAQIDGCRAVMQQLRPHINTGDFLSRIRLQQTSGYRLAYAAQQDKVVAVAGFRIGDNLAWGRFLYIDDLVTNADCRSSGCGTQMLDWLKNHAKQQNCDQLHLDSGFQRLDAHRFYEREGLPKTSFHFSTEI